ncbi:sulfotransferase [Bacillus sp. CMF12]|uniref:sulfotransferase family protein n=1 Tax=Bacillus sp. CMF12 TaxID=2884834 RepID=UPI00207A51CE|nr:sulfotransferase [Bacillus sp. CMF12]USK52295.1 sulfotransferase [Bacillus sp. CMF12]
MTLNKFKNPVFLVGCMRSGTTMYAGLLGSHPNIIHCPFELRRVWSREAGVPMAAPKTFDYKCPHLTEKDVKPGQREKLARAFLKEMRKNKENKKINNSLFLNKNPHLGNKLPFVNELFPDAKFIWIYRDMPSVTASLKRILNRDVIHYWPKKINPETVRCWECFFNGIPIHADPERCFPGGDIKYIAEYWYETNQAISNFSKSIPSDRIFLIKEEELVAQPEKIYANCLEFLSLPAVLPMSLLKEINPNRNELWSKRLNKEELNSLYNFVLEKGENLNFIFPEDNLFDTYKDQLYRSLGE